MHHDELEREATGARLGVSSGTPTASDLADLARRVGSRTVLLVRIAGAAVGRLRPQVMEVVAVAQFISNAPGSTRKQARSSVSRAGRRRRR
jgi:hypothetical protein